MAAAPAASISIKPPLDMTLRLKLSVMMFLQFAIWGAWFVILGNYLKGLDPQKFTDGVIGGIYGTMALGTIFSPLIVGQIADRFFASEKLMAVLHFAGAGLLYWMGHIHEPTTFYFVSLVYALVYSPTLALSNSIAFAHVPDGNRDFPGLRVLGTVGWIVVNWIVGLLLTFKTSANTPVVPNAPFLLGSACSLALGAFSLVLPHTPPPGKAGDAFPFLKAIGLLKDFSFAVFFGVSFVITIVLAFYYGFTGLYLEKGVHLSVESITPVMTIGQFAELLLLPFLPWFLKRWGMKWVLAFGMLCWGIRYGLFSIYAQADAVALYPLVLIGIALHGICFDFFFAAGFIHVDNKAPADIRGSGQALFTFLTYGVGMWLGNMVSGQLADFLTNPSTKAVDWGMFWMLPAIGVLICFAVFIVFFRDSQRKAEV
ncbi:MAG TPA: MFS transporter [Gemmataceae bacterium]|nr:MFS transporter [Gemmataceae bacterium]